MVHSTVKQMKAKVLAEVSVLMPKGGWGSKMGAGMGWGNKRDYSKWAITELTPPVGWSNKKWASTTLTSPAGWRKKVKKEEPED